jgi:putative salt-induced outer membrane protein YdiY
MKALEIALIASLALVLAAQAQDAPKPAVSTKLNLGLSLADGNSETLSANASLVAEGEKDLFGSFRAGVEAAMSERLGLRVVLQDAYQSIPADGKERNDLTLVSGLSLAL